MIRETTSNSRRSWWVVIQGVSTGAVCVESKRKCWTHHIWHMFNVLCDKSFVPTSKGALRSSEIINLKSYNQTYDTNIDAFLLMIMNRKECWQESSIIYPTWSNTWTLEVNWCKHYFYHPCSMNDRSIDIHVYIAFTKPNTSSNEDCFECTRIHRWWVITEQNLTNMWHDSYNYLLRSAVSPSHLRTLR
jgi:hypothetical protein